MKIKHFPYRLGLIIPTSLIIVNGATTWKAVLKYDTDLGRNGFIMAYLWTAFSYFLAVTVPPGYTTGEVVTDALYVKCTKCGFDKPERAHHCRICNRCVLRMDHHCPWTENCVGFRNLGHFLRFLSSTILLTGYGMYRSGQFLLYAWQHRGHLHLVVSNKLRIYFGIYGVLANFLVCFTLSLLWLRVVMDTANGQTQIENWEQERAFILAKRQLGTKIEFPFDIDYISNLEEAIGPVLGWILPWGQPQGSGHVFNKIVNEGRWPPTEKPEVQEHEYYRKDRWVSFEGEQLADFGVDDLLNDDKPGDSLKKTQ